MAARPPKECQDIKLHRMTNRCHSRVLFFQHAFIIQKEEERLYQIVLDTASPEQFCMAHELVNRNRITSNKNRIAKEARRTELRPFRFLINKN